MCGMKIEQGCRQGKYFRMQIQVEAKILGTVRIQIRRHGLKS